MAKKIIGALVIFGLLGGVVGFIYALTNNKITIGYNKGYKPDQPIPFSHELHSGKYKMECKYCHSNVAISRHSSVPSLNICMNCHLVVKTGSPWIQKIKEKWENNESVAWEKVHLLPDHVKFNHSAHIQAGQQCTTCHGQVQEMPVVYQHSSLAMGWCVNCHRKPAAKMQTTASGEDVHTQLNSGGYYYNDAGDYVYGGQAPVNCGTCHY